MSDSIIGRRVEAWIGPRAGETGTITRVNGIYRVHVRWDADNAVEEYRAADLIRVDVPYADELVKVR